MPIAAGGWPSLTLIAHSQGTLVGPQDAITCLQRLAVSPCSHSCLSVSENCAESFEIAQDCNEELLAWADASRSDRVRALLVEAHVCSSQLQAWPPSTGHC